MFGSSGRTELTPDDGVRFLPRTRGVGGARGLGFGDFRPWRRAARGRQLVVSVRKDEAVDPGKRPTGIGAEHRREILMQSLRGIRLRRRSLRPDQSELVDVHVTETYLRERTSGWLALPAHLEDCRGCYYLG